MLEFLTSLVLVGCGGALGAAARFAVSGLVGRRVGETFPWGTLAVNASGSFIAGAAAGADVGAAPSLFFIAGVIGAFTTVSSFSLQTLALARGGEPVRAGANVALSLGLCLGAAALGLGAFAR